MSSLRTFVFCALAAAGTQLWGAQTAWTNVAGNVVFGEVVRVDRREVTLVTGVVTQRLPRSVFPAAELARLRAASTAPLEEPPSPPAAIAAPWREYAAKCAEKTVTRGDLICLKRFIAASELSEAEKRFWIEKARGMRKPKEQP